MWVLFLNPMRGRAEEMRPVAWSETRAALEAFVARERVEPYLECGWTRFFRAGPLEWFNLPYEDNSSFGASFVDAGTLADALMRVQQEWVRFQAETLSV